MTNRSSGAVGFLLAVLGAIMNGSWSAIIKFPQLASARLHPAVVMNVHWMFGFFCVAWCCIFDPDVPSYSFTPYGVLSGGLLVVASAVALSVTIPVLGIALAACVSNTAVIVTSLVWSAYILDQPMRSVRLAGLGVAVAIVGLYGVVYATVGMDNGSGDKLGGAGGPGAPGAGGEHGVESSPPPSSDRETLLPAGAVADAPTDVDDAKRVHKLAMKRFALGIIMVRVPRLLSRRVSRVPRFSLSTCADVESRREEEKSTREGSGGAEGDAAGERVRPRSRAVARRCARGCCFLPRTASFPAADPSFRHRPPLFRGPACAPPSASVARDSHRRSTTAGSWSRATRRRHLHCEALFVGVIGGSVLVPMEYAAEVRRVVERCLPPTKQTNNPNPTSHRTRAHVASRSSSRAPHDEERETPACGAGVRARRCSALSLCARGARVRPPRKRRGGVGGRRVERSLLSGASLAAPPRLDRRTAPPALTTVVVVSCCAVLSLVSLAGFVRVCCVSRLWCVVCLFFLSRGLARVSLSYRSTTESSSCRRWRPARS